MVNCSTILAAASPLACGVSALPRIPPSACVFQGIADARFSRSWMAFQMNVDAVSG